MNIALFPSSFHPHVGGVEEVVRQLALQLRARGHRPLIITNRWPKDLPERDTLEGLPIQRFNFRVPERTWRQMGGSLLYGPATLRQVVRAVREHHADILHVHCVSSNAHYALAVKRRLKLPLVVTTHAELTMDATQLFQRSEFARDLMRRALTEAEIITACATHTLEEAECFLRTSLAGKSRVIFNGAPALEDVPPYCHPRPFVLAMGRLVPQKGFDLLLRAFERVAQRPMANDQFPMTNDQSPMTNCFDLLLAGDGPERSALEQLRDSLSSKVRIHFLGWQSRRQIHALLKSAAAFILPSRTDEGMPMALLEALAAGKPILATRSGGTAELLGAAALFTEKDNLDALAEKLRTLLTDGALRDSLATRAAVRARDFQWPAITGQYENAYFAAAGSTAAGTVPPCPT